jgi:hypothetical protein
MPRSLAEVVRVEKIDEPVDVVRLERCTHLFDKERYDGHQAKSLPVSR